MAPITPIGKYEHCGRQFSDLKEGRLITLTGEGTVRRYDTGQPVNKPVPLLLKDVKLIPPAGTAIVDGMQVNNDGTVRKNTTGRQWILSKGSFLVWW